MKDTVDSKRVIGSFIGRYIALAIIIGGISFLLENVVPQFVNWDLTAGLLIYQTVLFIISTLLTITLAVKYSIKNTKITTKEEAQSISKPIQTLLIIIALLVMGVNVIYYTGTRSSYIADAETRYPTIEGVRTERDEILLAQEKVNIYAISGFYLGAKEVITILTYAYAVIYVEMMLENEVQAKPKAKKTKKEEKTAKIILQGQNYSDIKTKDITRKL